MFNGSVIADDLGKLYGDFAESGLVRALDNSTILGFFERAVLEPEADDGGYATASQLLLRSPQVLGNGETITQGSKRWKITSVLADEGEYRYALNALHAV